MNIVCSSGSYRIFDDSVQTLDTLPNGVYTINFSPMAGYSLSTHDNLEYNGKIYGDVNRRVEKILKGFKDTDRNFGVILSGDKGSGKSLTVRSLSQKADYPTIIVDGPTPGLSDFLSSIKQECVIIFDEFDKTFGDSEDYNPQEFLLSLLDGIDNGKKLYVITCNDLYRINSYLLNRPGRFHYHFKYGVPTVEEINEYLNDNLLNEYKNLIPKIVNVSEATDLSFDSLRAIVFEINRGYNLVETLNDLNISIEGKDYDITITFDNGFTYTEFFRDINIFKDHRLRTDWFTIGGYKDSFEVISNTKHITRDGNGLLYIPKVNVKLDYYGDEENIPSITSLVLTPHKYDVSTSEALGWMV